MRILTILLFTTFSLSLVGQNEGEEGKLIAITVGLTPLIDAYQGSSYRIGIEKGFSRRISLFVQGGGYFRNFIGRDNISGKTIRLEFKKYYDVIDPSPIGMFYSIDFFHKAQSYSRLDTIQIASLDDYTVENRISKSTTTITLKIGESKVFFDKLFFEAFFGLGIRFKNTKTNLTDEEHSGVVWSDEDGAAKYLELELGPIIRPNVALGFRIGYRIR